MSLEAVNMGVQSTSTMFGISSDRRNAGRMYRATSGGEVFGSRDDGPGARQARPSIPIASDEGCARAVVVLIQRNGSASLRWTCCRSFPVHITR